MSKIKQLKDSIATLSNQDVATIEDYIQSLKDKRTEEEYAKIRESVKGNHKYLNELGVSSEDICIFNTKETENGKTTGRTKRFSEQRKTYGFDERETWALNYTLITWLYSHLLMYKETSIVDMDSFKVTVPKLVPLKKKEMVEPHIYFKEKPAEMTFGAAIDLAIEYMKEYILNGEDFGEDGDKAYEKGKTALKIVAEIFGALWW